MLCCCQEFIETLKSRSPCSLSILVDGLKDSFECVIAAFLLRILNNTGEGQLDRRLIRRDSNVFSSSIPVLAVGASKVLYFLVDRPDVRLQVPLFRRLEVAEGTAKILMYREMS